jgi:hypothetical protein
MPWRELRRAGFGQKLPRSGLGVVGATGLAASASQAVKHPSIQGPRTHPSASSPPIGSPGVGERSGVRREPLPLLAIIDTHARTRTHYGAISYCT